jgi:hypothetical protein
MRLTVLCLVGGLVAIAVSDCAKGATYSEWTTWYDAQINSANQSPNARIWLKSLVAPPNTPFPDPGSVATPTPTPIPQGTNPPEMPTTPPSYVTDCPNLAFSDDFKESDFGAEISEWGPIIGPIKWIANKPDGFNFGGYYNQASNASWAYSTASGQLVIDMHNYYQAPGTTYQNGNGNWFTGAIASAAWKNQVGGGTATTGFLASAPCYWQAAVWIPPLTSCDVPNAAGLWPSISLYTDPQLGASVGKSMELDLFELYSINFKIPHFSWHIWSSSGNQLSAGGSSPIQATDMSLGWHIYGLWIDTGTIHWYLDGIEVFTAPNPGGVGLEPFYVMLTNGYGGGWTVSLTPAQTYDMHVAYVACWTN